MNPYIHTKYVLEVIILSFALDTYHQGAKYLALLSSCSNFSKKLIAESSLKWRLRNDAVISQSSSV